MPYMRNPDSVAGVSHSATAPLRSPRMNQLRYDSGKAVFGCGTSDGFTVPLFWVSSTSVP